MDFPDPMDEAHTLLGRPNTARESADARGDECARALGRAMTTRTELIARCAAQVGPSFARGALRTSSVNRGTCRLVAAPDESNRHQIHHRPDPRHVVKAERFGADATDCGESANSSPVGGPMGIGYPAAAGPFNDQRPPNHRVTDFAGWPANAKHGRSAGTIQRPRPKGSARSLQALARPLTATRGHLRHASSWPHLAVFAPAFDGRGLFH